MPSSASGVMGRKLREVVRDHRQLEHAPVRLRQRLVVRRDDQDVGFRREEDLVRCEVLVDRLDHAQHETVVDLVQVQPLSEDAVRREIGADALVELVGEEPAHAAHPRIRRLRQDEVELPVRRREVALGVVVHVLRARVVEHPAVHRIERVRAVDHLGLDVDRDELLERSGCRAGDGSTCRTRCRSPRPAWRPARARA